MILHNPNTTNDPKVVMEQRRRATIAKMNRLGLSSITAEEGVDVETEEGTEEEEGESEEEEYPQPANAGINIKMEIMLQVCG